MAMSRKHYEAAADSFKRALELGYDRGTIAFLAGAFINDFATDNARFDAERFIKATGLAG